MSWADLWSVCGSTLRLATPLILAALGGVCSERAGIAALGLEGMMLGGAFAAGCGAALTQSAWIGLAAAIIAGMVLALLHGVVCIRYRGDQIVSGMALNVAVAGLCPMLGLGWFGLGGGTPALEPGARFMPVLLGQCSLVFGTLALVPLIRGLLYGTRFGLALRAAGENPDAVTAAGLHVASIRYRALALCGALTGAAGAYIAIADGAGFSRDMTAGRGYVALAALISGKWRPVPAAAACFLFAGTDAVQLRLQGVDLPILGELPTQLVQAFPYLVTLLALGGFVGNVRAPAALGRRTGSN